MVAAIHREAVAWNFASAIVIPDALVVVDAAFLREQALRVTETLPWSSASAIVIPDAFVVGVAFLRGQAFRETETLAARK